MEPSWPPAAREAALEEGPGGVELVAALVWSVVEAVA
jgi:hypothetical protein